MSRAAADITGLVFVWYFRAINLNTKRFFLSCWFMEKVDILFPLVCADGPMFWSDQW